MSGIDYANVNSVRFGCARKYGFAPKNKVVGVWDDKCGICHKRKPCTNLWHDWNPPKEEVRK